jgi:adenine phosphoribosyltransferase
MTIKSRIRTVPDYPKKGIMFRDITTLIKDPVGFRLVIDTKLNAIFVLISTSIRLWALNRGLSSVLHWRTLGRAIPIRKKEGATGSSFRSTRWVWNGPDEIHKDALRRASAFSGRRSRHGRHCVGGGGGESRQRGGDVVMSTFLKSAAGKADGQRV